jgi:hypothetical protein
VEAQIGVSDLFRRHVQVVDREPLCPDGDAADRIQLLQFARAASTARPTGNTKLDTWLRRLSRLYCADNEPFPNWIV